MTTDSTTTPAPAAPASTDTANRGSAGSKALAIIGGLVGLIGALVAVIWISTIVSPDDNLEVLGSEKAIAVIGWVPAAICGVGALVAAIMWAASNRRPGLWWRLLAACIALLAVTWVILKLINP